MKTLLILTGKTTDKNIAAGITDYTGRIGHYMPFETNVIPELKNTKSLTHEQQKEKEGELILKQIQTADKTLETIVGVRTRMINRALRDVEELGETGSIKLLEVTDEADE